jgi:hypothetical protein
MKTTAPYAMSNPRPAGGAEDETEASALLSPVVDALSSIISSCIGVYQATPVFRFSLERPKTIAVVILTMSTVAASLLAVTYLSPVNILLSVAVAYALYRLGSRPFSFVLPKTVWSQDITETVADCRHVSSIEGARDEPNLCCSDSALKVLGESLQRSTDLSAGPSRLACAYNARGEPIYEDDLLADEARHDSTETVLDSLNAPPTCEIYDLAASSETDHDRED